MKIFSSCCSLCVWLAVATQWLPQSLAFSSLSLVTKTIAMDSPIHAQTSSFLVTHRCMTILWDQKSDKEKEAEDEKIKNKNLVSLEEMDYETSQLEKAQANKIWFSLMAPYEISRYVTTALWVFVAVGFVLNSMGYAYVWKDGQLTIDTLAQRQFQDELARGLREASRNAATP